MSTEKKPYPTPHIKAEPGDFAKTVLMPGDPLRSRYIAEKFLTDARLVNNVRGVQGYTGLYKGKPVSTMASGMGQPSIGIYSWELYHVFGVDNIIRVGTAGAYQPEIELRDIVIAQGACTDSSWQEQYHLAGSFAPIASYRLLKTGVEAAEEKGLRYHVGNFLSSDRFYGDDDGVPQALSPVDGWVKMGVLAVEMETAALYCTAARAQKNALAICTISDHVIRGGQLTSDERQSSLDTMLELALETAIRL